jgi:hypothetical protein
MVSYCSLTRSFAPAMIEPLVKADALARRQMQNPLALGPGWR